MATRDRDADAGSDVSHDSEDSIEFSEEFTIVMSRIYGHQANWGLSEAVLFCLADWFGTSSCSCCCVLAVLTLCDCVCLPFVCVPLPYCICRIQRKRDRAAAGDGLLAARSRGARRARALEW